MTASAVYRCRRRFREGFELVEASRLRVVAATTGDGDVDPFSLPIMAEQRMPTSGYGTELN